MKDTLENVAEDYGITPAKPYVNASKKDLNGYTASKLSEKERCVSHVRKAHLCFTLINITLL